MVLKNLLPHLATRGTYSPRDWRCDEAWGEQTLVYPPVICQQRLSYCTWELNVMVMQILSYIYIYDYIRYHYNPCLSIIQRKHKLVQDYIHFPRAEPTAVLHMSSSYVTIHNGSSELLQYPWAAVIVWEQITVAGGNQSRRNYWLTCQVDNSVCLLLILQSLKAYHTGLLFTKRMDVLF